MPNASKQACGKPVKPAACWPYAMHISANTLFCLGFFTVPKALVVSGDSTSSAGFSSGTSGLGYLHATTSFQRQNSNQSLFKIFQPILEHLPARKRSFINIKYIYNKYINMDFCGFYTNSTRLFAGFSLQKRKTKFLHLSRLEPALSNMSR